MLMKLVTSSKTYNITAYAPQHCCEDEEKEEFWNKLAEVTDNIKQTEEIVLIGDLNDHVGAEREEYERWHGCKLFDKQMKRGR